MKSLSVRLLLIFIAVVAAAYGCSSDGNSPTAPSKNTGIASVSSVGDCDAAVNLSALAPALAEWRDSLESEIGGTFDAPPAFAEESVAEDYLVALGPILAQWEMAINDAESGTVDPIPAFDPETNGVPEYLLALSNALAQWEVDLESAAERDYLPTLPVYIGDMTPPVLVCPADTTVGCAPDSAGVAVDFDGLISVTDDCDESPGVICEPASGSTFLVGTTVVTYTAVDSAGNSSECTFSVTVELADPPVITCPEDIAVECEGPGGVVVDFDVSATSECDDSVEVVCTPASGSTFPLGETVVTCTATDAAGNSSECSFTVTVEDTAPPEIISATPSDSDLWPPNHKMIDVSISVEVSDVCASTPTCTIVDVMSNEDVNGRGDGNTEPDFEITGDLTVKLRAERAGPGSGRIYYVVVNCSDDAGNSAEHTVEVYVTHDRGKGVAR